MDHDAFDALDARVEARAVRLWTDAGQPEGGHARYVEQARELTAIEEVDPPVIDPIRAARPVIEEAEIQRNLGEFPTLRDQGDEMTFPDPEAALASDPYAEDDIRLSDGDASDTGGMLPDDDAPMGDLPDASVADADLTTSAPDADDDPLPDDLNDDGMPDPEDIDSDEPAEDDDLDLDEDDLDDDDRDDGDDLDDDDIDEDDAVEVVTR